MRKARHFFLLLSLAALPQAALADGDADAKATAPNEKTPAAKVEADSLIDGDYYFEAEYYNLVRVDFSPSKLVKKTMFKLKELNMTIIYSPGPEGYWLPSRFEVEGKGKAALFFGVNFNGTEWFRNPEINRGLKDSIFEVAHGE